ncbi:MAG TPA: PAS domain-containing sensor histidine kinase, partial [Flavipsychrobacter sp.]|nr:PAS domain-containing sensor histidine kinase [Flavipsychrobacter sp.]
TDAKGVITSFNVGAENLLGYSREEMVHLKTPQIIHLAEEMEVRGKELSEKLGKTVQHFDVFTELAKVQQYETREWTYVRKDGTKFPVQLTVTAVREKDEIVGYLGIAADISEIKRVEREIKSLLDVTNAQNERLRNFAHIVSHNLRSHSGNISILLDLFLQENEEKAEDELLKNLLQSANNLRDTIVHLNEVVVMNNSVDENLKPIHLRSVVDAAIQNVRAIAQDKNVRIENNVDAALYVEGVDAYMDSIVLNFLTNGIKYKSAERDAYVRVQAVVKDGYAELEFADNGIGMDLKRIKHKLFGMYKTFHGNSDARGIGLFITKNQVEAMGGRIDVESEENKGTSFKVYLRHAQKD